LSDTERDDAVKAIAKIPTANGVPKTVVITQGKDPTIICRYDPATKKMEFYKIDVKKIKKDEIVDTNGAGDSFAGGFMIGLTQEKSL